MKKWITILCCLCLYYAITAQPVKQMEYFFDKDPGIGKGKPIPIATADTIRINVPDLSTTGLSEGMHALYVRSKNDSGWSHFESFPFYVKSIQNGPSLSSAEYFFDKDPGVGKATAINTGLATDTVRLDTIISAAGLTQGMHALYVRSKDAAGAFSHFESFPFYVVSTANMPKISAAEYFYKTDPGPGKAAALNISPSADTITKSFHIPIPCLDADSTYNLYIRVKDEQGNWSHFETDTFKVRGANTVITVKAGLWSDASTWSNNKVPDANTEIILNHSITVDINATCKYLYTFCHAVNVNNGKTLIVTGTLK